MTNFNFSVMCYAFVMLFNYADLVYWVLDNSLSSK